MSAAENQQKFDVDSYESKVQKKIKKFLAKQNKNT